MENYTQWNTNQEKAGLAILISDKVDFIKMNLIRKKEGYLITIKESIQQEDITVFNVYVPKSQASKYIK